MGAEPGHGATRSADHAGLMSAIRALHTLVFFAELSSIGWLLATGLTGRRDRSVAIAAVLVAIESAGTPGRHARTPTP